MCCVVLWGGRFFVVCRCGWMDGRMDRYRCRNTNTTRPPLNSLTPHVTHLPQPIPSHPHQVGFVLQSGVTWETALRLVQSELEAFQKEGIDPLSESVARELFFLAASKVGYFWASGLWALLGALLGLCWFVLFGGVFGLRPSSVSSVPHLPPSLPPSLDACLPACLPAPIKQIRFPPTCPWTSGTATWSRSRTARASSCSSRKSRYYGGGG